MKKGDSMSKVKLRIENMHCGSCATSIEMVLSNMEGVKKAKVDFNSKNAIIEFDDKKTNIKKMIELIGQAGYKAKK